MTCRPMAAFNCYAGECSAQSVLAINACCMLHCIDKASMQTVGRLENMVGWYHSHPGYGCWLSGIDVGTQMTQQQYVDPFLAIVVDPHRTIAAGKVEIGAFRTFPEVLLPSPAAN